MRNRRPEPTTNAQLKDEIERLRQVLWNAGVCADCGEEICHDITEPFASCACGNSEATTIPTIAALRYELHTTSFLLFKFTEGKVVKP